MLVLLSLLRPDPLKARFETLVAQRLSPIRSSVALFCRSSAA